MQSYLYWRDQSQSFQGIAAALFSAVNVSGFDKPERVESAAVSNNFFSVLGASPVVGRTFTPEENNGKTAHVAMISHGLYERRFGSSPDVLQRSVKLDGVESRIVGVLPRDFHMTAMWGGFDQAHPEVWVPLNTSGSQPLPEQQLSLHMVYARLKPGVTLEQARNEAALLESRLVKQFPKEYEKFGANVFTLYTEDVSRDLRRSLLVLQLAVGFVLLIACVNVANLLLVRAAAREREITVRLALGATRGRVVRQMLVESMLFSGLGSCIGLFLAYWGILAVAKLAPDDLHKMGLAPNVLVFTLLASLAAGILFGLAPALHAARQYFSDRGSGRTGQGGISRRVRTGLVIAEIALTIAPLTGAGLMVRTLHALNTLDLGIRPENVIDGGLALPETQYKTPQQLALFCDQLLSKMRALPQVESAALAGSPPMQSVGYTTFHLEGESADRPQTVDSQPVGDGYLHTMGTPVLQGRDFTPEEAEKEAGVAIVAQSLARHLWPGQDPIGKGIVFGEEHPIKRVIIGVVPDTRILALSPETHQNLYYPVRHFRNMVLIVRGRTSTSGLEKAMLEQIHSMDGDLPLHDVHPLTDVVRESLAQQRFTMFLLMVFAGLALALAAVGLYGVLAYTVAQRTREIGIRMALGAQAFDLLRMVLRQGFAMVVIGVVIGTAFSILIMRAMTSLLFGVRAHDPTTLIVVGLVFSLVALVACLVPARRAARVDPMVALRCE